MHPDLPELIFSSLPPPILIKRAGSDREQDRVLLETVAFEGGVSSWNTPSPYLFPQSRLSELRYHLIESQGSVFSIFAGVSWRCAGESPSTAFLKRADSIAYPGHVTKMFVLARVDAKCKTC